MAQFALDISKFAKETMDKADKVTRKTGLEVGRRLIMRTPVDEGTARGGWIPQVGSPSSAQPGTKDKSGSKTIAAVSTAVSTWKPSTGRSLFIINNVPYIEVLDKGRIGNKGSTQAPRGMVGVTVAEFTNIVEASV